MKKILALAAVVAMTLSATACNLDLGGEVTEEQKAVHEQYTKGYMLDVEEDGQVVTHFYACDDENTVASYGFYAGSKEEGASIDASFFLTGDVVANEDGTFEINQKDGFFEAVLQAEFLEDGSLSLIVDDAEPMVMPFVGAEPVVTLMQETAGFHVDIETE